MSSGYDINSSEHVVIPAKTNHSATVIFLHGLGDKGSGWSPVCADELNLDYVKYVCPTAPKIPVTINVGVKMPAWFDLYGLNQYADEDDKGIEASKKFVHSLIDAEIEKGIPSNRITVAGFSMGGALALYSGLTYDKPLAAIVALSAFVIQRSKLPGKHVINKNIPILMCHGEVDYVVPLTFAKLSEEFVKAFNPNLEMRIYPGVQHGCSPDELRDVKDFLVKQVPKV